MSFEFQVDTIAARGDGACPFEILPMLPSMTQKKMLETMLQAGIAIWVVEANSELSLRCTAQR